MNAKPELTEIAKLIAGEMGLTDVHFCGKGAFKETFRVKDKNQRFCALKLVDRTKIDLVRTEREIEALKRCDSQRVAKFFGTRNFTSPDGRLFDVMLEEFFDGGSLEEKILSAALSKTEVINLAEGLFWAVRDLHQAKLVHRDIKPANIMFRNGNPDPVLVDFGLVRDLSQISITASWLPHGPGTPLFASPEQLNNEKAYIDWRSDQFSIGVMISLLLTNRHPYQTDPANLASAIPATHQRKGPSHEFKTTMTNLGLPSVVKMVSAWPVQRFSNPDQVLLTFQTQKK